ncbi:unnamed protein product [Tilletia laevis]|uniref:cellulase n=4 Tax=Tilletia TaxID=13289 RepID=A0A9N8LZC4_9BASI|nr:unnamed protein product [Tilletia caries]CAD6942340.1 unnamed protein product [Tilletia laevis]CAD6949899.1 unnamed protein product [Tilletia laevis]CAD6953089.1 unnamed protein product [Tilletia caries]CAD7065993.1 unnamed protein product [Tilletia caries]
MTSLLISLLLPFLLLAATVAGEWLPSGPLTMYWDCCKPSAAWPNAAPVSAPAHSCARDGLTRLSDHNAQSICGGGPAYTCTNYQPFSIGNVGYVFSARANNGNMNPPDYLCGCYRLTTHQQPGLVLITQVLNEGGSLSDGQFDLQVPGGGVGDFNGCVSEYNSPPDGWGQRNGGIKAASECTQLPASLHPGCLWRFRTFDSRKGLQTTQSAERVKCPAALTKISGCVRHDDHMLADAPEALQV